MVTLNCFAFAAKSLRRSLLFMAVASRAAATSGRAPGSPSRPQQCGRRDGRPNESEEDRGCASALTSSCCVDVIPRAARRRRRHRSASVSLRGSALRLDEHLGEEVEQRLATPKAGRAPAFECSIRPSNLVDEAPARSTNWTTNAFPERKKWSRENCLRYHPLVSAIPSSTCAAIGPWQRGTNRGRPKPEGDPKFFRNGVLHSPCILLAPES